MARETDVTSGRETGTGMGTETGESPGVYVTEYDLTSQSERGARGEKGGAGETGEDKSRKSLITASAEGESVEVKGAVWTTKAEKAKVTGVSAVVSGRKVDMTGWAPLVLSSEEVEIEKGAAALALAGKKIEVEENGYLAFGLAPRIEVEEGGKVFVTLPMAIVAGLAFGVGWVVAGVLGLVWLRRQGGLRGMLLRRRVPRQSALGRVRSAAGRFTGGRAGDD